MQLKARASQQGQESKDGPSTLNVAVNHQRSRRWCDLKIVVEVPLTRGWRVNIRFPPFTNRLLTAIKLYHRTVIGKLRMGPVFQETREVFRSAAVGAVTSSGGSRDDAGDDRCIDGGVGCDARAGARKRIRVIPRIGENIHGISQDGAGRTIVTRDLRLGWVA